jgi:hypothetical protein
MLIEKLLENARRPFDKPFERLTLLSRVEASKDCVTLVPRPVKFSLRETTKPI